MTRRAALLIGAAAILPRLATLLHERGDILAAYRDKSDDFAQTFLGSGTFGFVPGVPSAYTQPLYGYFLIPIYWIADRHWLAVGLVQIAVAAATAWLVYLIGRRVLSERAALVAALLTTLHPYVIWHDVHLNREILDGFLAAAIVLASLVCAQRPTPLNALVVGAALGLGILANARLALLPLVVCAWLAFRLDGPRRRLLTALAVLLAAAVVVSPWVIRNRVSVGCFALTTDSRALWKANNLNTYDTLARGGWIDDVPPLPGSPPSPQDAGAIYRETGRVVRVDECAQMDLYQDEVVDFWREHPGEKGRLAAQAAGILWQPDVLETQGRQGAGTWLDPIRTVVEPAFMIALYLAALVGLWTLPRSFLALALSLLAYQSVVAMIFAGATRYRVPWDFLVALMAAAGLETTLVRARASRQRRASPQPG